MNRPDDPPELSAAKSTLAAAATQLAAAEERRRRVEAVEAAVADLDDRIAVAEADVARREYAVVLAHLDRVKAEAAVLQSGAQGADADRQLLHGAEEARRLAAAWSSLVDVAAQVRGVDVDVDGIEPSDVPMLAEVPDAVPHDLGELVAELVRATDHAAVVGGAAPGGGERQPARARRRAHPALATLDQDELWSAHARVLESTASLQPSRSPSVASASTSCRRRRHPGTGEQAAAIAELEQRTPAPSGRRT